MLVSVAVTGYKGPGDAATDPRLLTGLGLSWLGDVALLGEGDGPFTLGLGSFLLAHLSYLAAFRRRGAGVVRDRMWVAAAYGMAWCSLNALLWNRTGRLRLPVLTYGTILTAMGLAAFDTGNPETAIGGAAFLLSDSILAMDKFGVVALPAADGMVMATYTAAQGLIALSLSNRARRPKGP